MHTHTKENLNKLDYTTVVQQARAASTLVSLCPAFLQVQVSGHGLVASSFNTCLVVSGFLASPSEWAWFGRFMARSKQACGRAWHTPSSH
jgi:hypothetical protein